MSNTIKIIIMNVAITIVSLIVGFIFQIATANLHGVMKCIVSIIGGFTWFSIVYMTSTVIYQKYF